MRSSLVICMSTMCAFLFMLRATLSSRCFGFRSSGSVHVAYIIVARERALWFHRQSLLSTRTIHWFFDVTLVSFVHMCIHRRHPSRVKKKHERVQCRLLRREFVFHGVKFTQCRRRLVTRVHHSVCANNTAWRLAFSRRLLRRRPCEQFLTTDQNAAQFKISRRVVLEFRLCTVASISSTIKSCKREVTQDDV